MGALRKAARGISRRKSTTLGDSTDEPPSLVAELHACIRDDMAMSRQPFFRPSSLGGCMREAYYAFLKVPHEPQDMDTKLRLILDTGTQHHDVLNKWFGRTQRYFFTHDVSIWIPRLKVFGHADAVMVNRRTLYRWVVEFKSINKDGFMRLTKPRKEHIWQANLYTGLLGLPWFTVFYWCKDNQDVREFKVRFGQELFDEAMEWCDEVRELVVDGLLPDYIKKTCDERFCSFVARCRKARRADALKAEDEESEEEFGDIAV